MRRTPYSQRLQRSFLELNNKNKAALELQPFTYKLESTRIAEDNYFSVRTPLDQPAKNSQQQINTNSKVSAHVPSTSSNNRYNYYQPKLIKATTNRPNTTNKTNSFLQIKRQGNDSHLSNRNTQPYPIQKDLLVTTLKDQSKLYRSHLAEHHPYGITGGGRLYRGSSWKVDQKVLKDQTQIYPTNRYQRKNQSPPPEIKEPKQSPNTRKSRKSTGLFDLIGYNLKKSQNLNHQLNQKQEEDFFEYVMRFSYRTKKGYIPSNPSKVNQDSFLINPNINNKTWQHLFGICDGHGPLGHHVSGYIKSILPQSISNLKSLEKNPRQGLLHAFEHSYNKMLKQSNIDMSFSGSTVITCYLQQNKLYCANVGDSRAVLGKNRNHQWSAHPLSQDHKPNLVKEAQRIKKMKGRVEAYKDQNGEAIGPLRVWIQHENVPGLAMTRSFGDLVGASVGVSPIPEIKQFKLTQEDKIIVIGSDGVFQFLQNQEIIKSLVPYYESKQIQQASDNLLSMACKSWTKNSSIIDDITFILIFINYNEI